MMPENNLPPVNEVRIRPPDEEVVEVKKTAVQQQAEVVQQHFRVIQFRHRAMVMLHDDYPHFVPMTKERFDRLFYTLIRGQTRSRVGDVYAEVQNTSPDFTHNDHYILFGMESPLDDDYYHNAAKTRVWDMHKLEFVDVPPETAVWRSPYGVIETDRQVPFVMSLAGGDHGLYDDIMQSLAPMVMERKPDGVIWWVGDGANGKSTLMDAIYRIFPGQLSSITVKRLADGRDTPSLNGTLANIVKESSEGRVDDTETYKSIGTHEDFKTHKFHSQEDITIRGNLHHIFSANNIPVFNDKGHSAKRRTFIVPFTQRFQSDPNFEKRTFTPDMFGQLIYEICRYAARLKDQNLRYKFSGATEAAKVEYDASANNCEEYARAIIAEGIVAFESFRPLRMDYENWCAENGYVALGMGNFRAAVQAIGFKRVTARTADKTTKIYRLETVEQADLKTLGFGRPGLYTSEGFQPEPDDTAPVPGFEKPLPPDDDVTDEYDGTLDEPAAVEEQPAKRSILNNRW